MALFPDITRDDIFRLETKRLWLRWLRATDATALSAIAGLAEVALMTSTIPHPYAPGEAERFILQGRADAAAGDALLLAVTTKARSRALVGVVSAQPAEPHVVEIGYMIAPGASGDGLGSEATSALVDVVFELTEARLLTANSLTENVASRRVLEKCGFCFAHTAPHDLPARGGRHACDFFSLDRHGWSARQRHAGLPAMAQQSPRERLDAGAMWQAAAQQ